MTDLTDAQLDWLRATIGPTIEEWRVDFEILDDKAHRDLEVRLVMMLYAMYQSGTITVNQAGGSPESEVKC